MIAKVIICFLVAVGIFDLIALEMGNEES